MLRDKSIEAFLTPYLECRGIAHYHVRAVQKECDTSGNGSCRADHLDQLNYLRSFGVLHVLPHPEPHKDVWISLRVPEILPQHQNRLMTMAFVHGSQLPCTHYLQPIGHLCSNSIIVYLEHFTSEQISRKRSIISACSPVGCGASSRPEHCRACLGSCAARSLDGRIDPRTVRSPRTYMKPDLDVRPYQPTSSLPTDWRDNRFCDRGPYWSK